MFKERRVVLKENFKRFYSAESLSTKRYSFIPSFIPKWFQIVKVLTIQE